MARLCCWSAATDASSETELPEQFEVLSRCGREGWKSCESVLRFGLGIQEFAQAFRQSGVLGGGGGGFVELRLASNEQASWPRNYYKSNKENEGAPEGRVPILAFLTEGRVCWKRGTPILGHVTEGSQ